VLAVEFTQIRGLRELRDGRLLVSDRLDLGVVVVQFGSSAVIKVGRTGAGPQEYRLPTALNVMPGDSVMLADEGNQRVAVIGPDLKVARSFTLMLPGVGFPMGARGQDPQGRFVLAIPGWVLSVRGQPLDTIPLVRFDSRSQKVDTIARLKSITTPPPGQRLVPGFGHTPFSAQDVWALGPDGRIAIARVGDYHIEWVAPDGRVTRGPPTPYEKLPVTDADKLAFTRRFLEGSSISGKGEGGLSAIPAAMRDEENVRRMAEGNTFAAVKPPFTAAAPLISPEGTFWVERSGALTDPSTWDTFDGIGRLVGRLRLPPDRRLVGLGVRALYVVATDDDGIQRLERYARQPHRP
jgi:hypothetical protein